jgi:NSS family neurotransmitter:Na+ symporter
MPLIFEEIPAGGLFAFIWFVLLFIAGVTSSVSLIQPAVTFLKDELDMSHHKAVSVIGFANLLVTGFLVFTIQWGTLDEMDFWAATVCPVVAATIMVIFFSYILGVEKGFKEMEHGAALKVPAVYKFVLKYITPTYLIILLGIWMVQEWWSAIMMEKVTDPTTRKWIWIARIILLVVGGLITWVIVRANKNGKFPKLKEGDR